MIILTLRTDNEMSEIGLFDNGIKLGYMTWQAHRKLADTLHHKLDQLLLSNQINMSDLDGIVVYQGPGSFTGLRIGLSVANSLAYSLNIPIVGTSGDNWIAKGQKQLLNNQNLEYITPVYGSKAHTTIPKK